MTVTVRLILVLSFAVFAVSSAGILETLLSWDQHEPEGRLATPQSKCLCQTSGCLCCIDLNLTSTIDLGGPACINIKQKEQNVSLNLSYGDNPVHNATIRIDSAANKPTCMNLLSDLAQLCAKFTSITRSEQGHDGCLVIQPTLMKTPQVTYHIGCFNFNQGIRQIEFTSPTEKPAPAAEEEEEEEEVVNTDELIAAVSASAEQGIALFSQWLGLNLNPRLNLTTNRESSSVQSSSSSRAEANINNDTSRSARRMAETQQSEKSEERFKQLLSAQDNILKVSDRIGQPDRAPTTFVYSAPVDLVEAERTKDLSRSIVGEDSPQSSNLVPPGSQRGGRAYNIHLHINEV